MLCSKIQRQKERRKERGGERERERERKRENAENLYNYMDHKFSALIINFGTQP